MTIKKLPCLASCSGCKDNNCVWQKAELETSVINTHGDGFYTCSHRGDRLIDNEQNMCDGCLKELF